MGQTIARIKSNGKHFEIIVDLDKALEFKKTGAGNDFLEADTIFTDSKKGNVASKDDLNSCFKTTDVQAIAEKIVKDGEVLVSQEHRDAEQDKKLNQIIDFLTRNAVDPQTGNPHTAERIKGALNQASINIKNTPIEQQIKDIVTALSTILPIKIKTRKIKITVPATHTGRAYGIFSQYKEKENWLGNGDLEIIANIPSGILIDFYDQLNSVTHGSALTEEIKE